MGRLHRIAAVLTGRVVSTVVAPTLVRAQNTGIAGVVRDTSGAVLPGVTVEASSPVLIEKVRTVTGIVTSGSSRRISGRSSA